MAILFSNEIISAVTSELVQATSSVQIITAYCKENSFMHLNNCIKPSVRDRRLLVRFRMDDILNGSTDFAILEEGIKAGWRVYIRFDLHAKTYIVDKKRGLIGSANATNSGLGIGRSGNMEMATLIDIEQKDIDKIEKLFDDAILVSDELLTKLKTQIMSVNNHVKGECHTWDSSVITMFNPHIETLFSYELPEENMVQVGRYYSFLDDTFAGDKEKFKQSFRWSNAYLWLLTILEENNGCMYFGAITEKLHNALISDPKPYRRDVKVMLANLLGLIEELQMEEITIDRPSYSQRIRLASSIVD